MEVLILFNGKFMILAIFLVSLLAISAVSAEDNATSDVAISNDEVILNESIDDIDVLEDDNEPETVNSIGPKSFRALKR